MMSTNFLNFKLLVGVKSDMFEMEKQSETDRMVISTFIDTMKTRILVSKI